MEFTEAMLRRRSVRKYTGETVGEDRVNAVLAAGLLAPSSRGLRSAELIVVTDREELASLGKAKAGGSMLEKAAFAVAAVGRSAESDAWVEDCSIAMTQMMLRCTELGLGSCWIHCRNRQSTVAGVSSEDYVKELLGVPEGCSVLAILSVGVPAEQPTARTGEDADFVRVHRGRF